MNNNEYITDDCIIEDNKYSEIKDLIKCPLCSQIFKEPIKCKKCQNNYCKACIDNWLKKVNICPGNCINPVYVQSIDKINMLSLLIFRCKNCKEEIKYNDVESHLNSGCTTYRTESKLIESIYKKKKLKKLTNKEIEEIIDKGHKINYISSKNNIFNYVI